MPLRDHFRPPVSRQSSWEGFHGYWPAAMVRLLSDQLPPGYVAEPRVHLGTFFEIDVSTFENDPSGSDEAHASEPNGGIATAVYAPPAPTLTVEAEIPEQYEYGVLIYDVGRDRKLVAAVEIVSPGNKDRPESRQWFVVKCANLLQRGVCVAIVDLVTSRSANLYAELLHWMKCADPRFGAEPSAIYAATCRPQVSRDKVKLQTWSHELTIGQPLPALPIWLSAKTAVSLDLEASYEETCRVLRVS